jgi:mannosyl-oligosaccharide alpha-1,2-mannosidase
MKNWDAVEQIVKYIPKIDFSKTDDEVSLFETTIRYLGGLLSGISSLPLKRSEKNNS